MKRTFLSSLLCSVLLAGTGNARQVRRPRKLPGTKEEITALEARRFKAMTEADIAAIEPIFADELTYTHTSGWTQSKSEFIETIRSGKLRYLSIEPANERVRLYGMTAVGTGRAVFKVRVKGKEDTFQLRFIDVYVKRRGRWQMVAWQSTRLTP